MYWIDDLRYFMFYHKYHIIVKRNYSNHGARKKINEKSKSKETFFISKFNIRLNIKNLKN